MTPEQKAAFVISQSVCALAEILGMNAFNDQRKMVGLSPAYIENHFYRVIENYGLTHNQVISLFED